MTEAARDPIRSAVLGFGTSGRIFHAPFLAADPEYSLDVIVTGDPARRAAAAARHPLARVVATPEEVWADAAELDLVVIGSPSGTHAELADSALDAGLDVVVDKPFAVTADEGRALIAKAERFDRRITVFQNRRWDGDFLTLRELVAHFLDRPVHVDFVANLDPGQRPAFLRARQDPLDARHRVGRAFDRLGQVVFDLLRRGTRIGHPDLHARRAHVRHRLDAVVLRSQRTREIDGLAARRSQPLEQLLS